MPPVLITCPTTQELVPTGAHAQTWDEIDRLDERQMLVIACPACGPNHEWRRQDAVIAVE